MNLRGVFGLNKVPRTPADAARSPQEQFYAVLKAEFSPRLRAVGFKGSGQNFRRVIGDVIHAINIQSDPRGGSCIVNLGVHLTFLTDSLGRMWEPSRIREINCEFRSRLSQGPLPGTWWSYGEDILSSEASACSLIQSYFAEGESYFQHFSSVAPILTALSCKVSGSPEPTVVLGSPGSLVRVALAASRIHRHLNQISESQHFARIGLANTGPYTGALREELGRLAQPGA